MSLIALDIETKCGLGCDSECEHAVNPHRNTITIIGVWDGERGHTFATPQELASWLPKDARIVTHNGKFDLHSLATKGLDLSAQWAGDTLLMAATMVNKVPERYLWDYARRRTQINMLLPKGAPRHRPGTPNSLKVLAPYWLGVEPFWEDPSNHASAKYVLKDVEYTFRLYHVLREKLEAEGGLRFVEEKLFPWTRLLLRMERRGISIDLEEMSRAEVQARQAADEASRKLDEQWAPAYREYHNLQARELGQRYGEMAALAVEKLKDKTKAPATRARYNKMLADASARIEPFNLNSPTQLTWLLRDYLKLDISDFHGKESTGKPVLQRLAPFNEGVKTFLEYRKQSKLVSAFFPSYRAMAVNGAIHTNFNPVKSPSEDTGEEFGTAKGRLSSSNPNLQQVPKHLHRLFVARPGYKLLTYDAAAIEPRIICYYTQDENLYSIISQGKDYHNFNTAIFFGINPEEPEFKKKYALEREVGKEIGLALKYGAGNMRIRESAQKRGFVWSQREAQYKLEKFREFYAGVFRFREEVVNKALRDGPIPTLFGRPLVIENEDDIHLKGLNQLIQVSASDLIINSAARAQAEYDARGIDAHVLLLVHDECVVEVEAARAQEAETILIRSMTDYKLSTPIGQIELKVEGKVSDSWEK